MSVYKYRWNGINRKYYFIPFDIGNNITFSLFSLIFVKPRKTFLRYFICKREKQRLTYFWMAHYPYYPRTVWYVSFMIYSYPYKKWYRTVVNRYVGNWREKLGINTRGNPCQAKRKAYKVFFVWIFSRNWAILGLHLWKFPNKQIPYSEQMSN